MEKKVAELENEILLNGDLKSRLKQENTQLVHRYTHTHIGCHFSSSKQIHSTGDLCLVVSGFTSWRSS